MNLVLITREEADQRSLMHYRTKGSKNGQRLYQNKDGSLTPLGYAHYSAMYGWGKIRAKTPAERADLEAERAERKAEQRRIKAEKAHAKEDKINRSEKEISKDIKSRIQQFNEKTKAAKEERTKKLTGLDEKGNEEKLEDKRFSLGEKHKMLAIVDQNQLKEQQESIKKARGMSDDELRKAINRLQMEKQYSELLNERANREKGPLYQMASKLMQDAAQDLAKKALGVVVDKVIDKAKEKTPFKLADFKDVDPYSLPSDKLKAVSEAFNNAANLARNRNVVDNGGRDPNQGGGNNGGDQQQKKDNGGNQQQSKGTDNSAQSNQTNGENGQLTKNQRKNLRAMARNGASAEEIAKRFGVSESTVRQYAGDELSRNTVKETAKTESSGWTASAHADGSTDSKTPAFKADTSKESKQSRKAFEKAAKEYDASKIKTPERKENESMSDYWDRLLTSNGATTKASREPKGTTHYIPLSDVQTPTRKSDESMADYWQRLVNANEKNIKSTAKR